MILLLFVVPVFQNVFKSAGVALPAFTQMVVSLSEFMQSYWLPFLIVVVVAIVGIVMAYKRSEKMAHCVDRMSLKIPIIGNILRQSAIARFARTLGVTFAAGVPLVEALDSVSGATGSVVYGQAIRKMRDDIAVGHQLHLAMAPDRPVPQHGDPDDCRSARNPARSTRCCSRSPSSTRKRSATQWTPCPPCWSR